MQQNIHGGDIYSRQIRLDFSVNGNPLGMPDAEVQPIMKQCSMWENIQILLRRP